MVPKEGVDMSFAEETIKPTPRKSTQTKSAKDNRRGRKGSPASDNSSKSARSRSPVSVKSEDEPTNSSHGGSPILKIATGALLVGSTVDEYRYWAMGYASSAEAAAALESSTREHIGTYLALDLDLVAGAQVTPNATWGPEQATCAADYVLRKAAEAYSTHKPLPLAHADVDADAKQAAAEMMVGDSAAAPSILSAEQAAAHIETACRRGCGGGVRRD